ncbi:ribonuclease Z [Salipaludibacillus keqinensis]|uniref:Ribonuclease Z n=1 Tax=Salipaludibacillus keqinensis TaxID=2045207 RepID=A0A323TD03_9BACI|nr:ribonuclease Z [Salipaludibacillus keqinensis]PYZ91737.1 ribonuclease Z [Salipaludibacillus keqinensis]
MKLTFLGTGAGIPAKKRNVSSLALHLMNKQNSVWLFDCGEATQHQILYTSVKLRKIENIFITHLHGDHIYGLPGLLGSRSFQGAKAPLTVYGPVGIHSFIETSLQISGTYLNYPLKIVEVDNGGLLLDNDKYIVTCSKLDHALPSFGFRVQEKDLPGPLLMEEVNQANIPAGPILQKLKNGEDVILPDGRIVQGKSFIGPVKRGKIVTILGDTRSTESAITLANGANTLVHEATFAKNEEALAHQFFHSTTAQAAEVAQRAGAHQLILNHISSRYQKDNIEQLVIEARDIFPNTFIAEDLSMFEVPAVVRNK